MFTRKDVSLEGLTAWCIDANSMLAAVSKLPSISEMQKQMILSVQSTKDMWKIAEDLAYMLGEEPRAFQEIARDVLLSRYGFSFESINDAELKAIEAIVQRGRVGRESEARRLIDFLSDRSPDYEFGRSIARLVDAWEERRAGEARRS